MRKFKVTDIHLDYSYCPNDDIYTDDYPKEMIVSVEDDSLYGDELFERIKHYIIENIEVEFDTPDEPYYEVDDADFEYEEVK